MKPILYDVLRLFISPFIGSPRGIDRADAAFAQHFFSEAPGEIVGVMPTPWGARTYDRLLVQNGLAQLATTRSGSGSCNHRKSG